MSHAHVRRLRLLPLLLLGACALAQAASATEPGSDPAPEVQQLLSAGHWVQAQQRLDMLQKQSPNDPRWVFDRALALSGAGQRDAAIALYTELTERYPELPEPYNNLGVLQAQQGQLQAALQSLQLALLANPNDGLARENLGDVELQVALADYTAASALPGHSPKLNDKIKQLRQVAPAPPRPAAALTTSPILH